MKSITVLVFATLTFGCVEATNTTAMISDGKVPNPFVIVGEVGPGEIAADELRAVGLTVVTNPTGRAAGLTAFCTGNADAFVYAPGNGWSSAERDRCKAIRSEGWSWSATSTPKGMGLTVRYSIVDDLVDTVPEEFWDR